MQSCIWIRYAIMTPIMPPPQSAMLETLRQISRLLESDAGLPMILPAIVEAACALIPCQAASLLQYEEETGLLKFIAAPKDQWETLSRARVPIDASAAGQAFTQGKPIIVQDAAQASLIYRDIDRLLNFQTRSLLAAPIRSGSQTVGVIEAVNKHGNAHYTREDVTILEILAAYAAVALERASSQDAARRAQSELENLARMKADFIAITSHEMRTPLGLIIGHAALLKEELTAEGHSQQVDAILRSAGRLQKILEDLENLEQQSRPGSRYGEQPVDIGLLLKRVCRGFSAPARQRQIDLRVQAQPGEALAQVDAEKIAVAIGNLIENALTFTNPGGHILARAGRTPAADFVRITVMDDGVGIPAKDLPRVFDRFYQVEAHATRRHGGMGLGLAVARVMVELHGGQIWAESIEGRGSKFTILLPAANSPGQSPMPGL